MTLPATVRHRLHHVLIAFVIAALAGSAPLAAQSRGTDIPHIHASDLMTPAPAGGAPTQLAAAAPGATSWTLDMRMVETLRGNARVVLESFPLPSARVDLVLQSFSVFTPDAKIYAMTEAGPVRRALPDITVYKGSVAGVPGSWVFLAADRDGLSGTIITGGVSHTFYSETPASFTPGARPVLTVAETTPEMQRFGCGLTEEETLEFFRGMPDEMGRKSARTAAASDTLRALIAVEADLAAHNHYGGVTQTENYITARMAESSAIYERDVAITLMVPFMRVWTTQDPFPGNSDRELLNVFTTYWKDNMDTVERSLATLISRKPISASGVSQGLAWLDRLCSTTHGYSLVKFSANNGFTTGHTGVLAHELGHNFASPHTHSCTWNPAIDSCYTAEPVSGKPPCFTRDQQHLILGGGELMSYCHLSYGNNNVHHTFRDRVGGLIRSRAEAALCMDVTSIVRNLAITAPTETFSVCAGGRVTLTWDAQGVNDMSVRLSRDGGASYDTVLVSVLDRTVRSFVWRVPNDFPAGTRYRLKVQDNKNGSLVAEMPVDFTILEGVVILTQNTWRNVCVGQGARFEVVAKGPGTLRYEWRKNGTVLAGEVKDTMWVQNTTLNDNGSIITCTVYSDCGEVESEPALLKVFSSPVVLEHPKNDSVCVGGTATFRVKADGPELTYRWLTQQGYVSGANGPELVVPNVTATKAYWCEVSSPCGKTNTMTGIAVVPATGIDRVLTPAPYEELTPGTTFVLRWRQFCVKNVKLEYTVDGSVWNTIQASWPADSGWYGWMVPDTETQNGSFRVSSVETPTQVKISPSFKIVKKPVFSVLFNEVNFGLIPVGEATEKEVSIVNAGRAVLNITKTEIVGNADASVVQGAPLTLQPAQSGTVRVRVTPQVTGPLAGSLRVEHNGAGSPTDLAIVGDVFSLVSARPLPEPDGLALHQNYPNPVSRREHGVTLLTYDLPVAQTVSIAIVNTLGAIVRTVDLGLQGAGRHTTSIGLAGLPVGTYIVRMVVPGAMRSRVMQLVR